jgi:2'-hydroxyisoflavone reductase
VDAALARGHEVTLFNRGRSNPDLFPGLERLRGDRDGDLGALAGRAWDAVIDPSGYLPRQVRTSSQALGGRVGHYVFVSSISVYADRTVPGPDEDAAVQALEPGTPEVLSGETYGALKAACEGVLESLRPGGVTNVRAGLIFGPHDTTERSQYWVLRMARGGEVLAPGRPDTPVQLVDARDLAAWIVEAAERRIAGTFNATGPADPLPIGRFLEACRAAAGSAAELRWVDGTFLLESGVAPYSEMPLWVPEAYRAFGTVRIARALERGLAFRPLEDTLRDTLAWARALPPGPRPPRAGVPMPGGLAPERERALLAAWRTRCRPSSAVQ